jgi:hypothetical protein
MSIEVWQFPQAASKEELVDLLQSLGYEAGENLFRPGPPGTISLFWFERQDFISITGVDASVFPLSKQGKKAWNTSNGWAVRTRTSISASSFDKEFQNDTVRAIRRAFSGRFYNDHFGLNRYTVLESTRSTPASRGIYGVVSRIFNDLDSLEHALPDEFIKTLTTPAGEITDETDRTGILGFSKRLDPSRVVYNALIPFLVAAIEHFFRESFEILLKYDQSAQKAMEEQNKKLSFSEAAALVRGELTIERIVSGWYSFQNLNSIQKAFKDVLGIDVWKTIRRRKKVRAKIPMLSTSLENLIGARHGVVHRFSLDRNLNREGFLDLVHLVRALLEISAEEFERKLGVTLGPG